MFTIYKGDISTSILSGDCLELTDHLTDGSVNLIITSPPYSDQRKSTYGGIKPDEYVDWFMERSEKFMRVLADDGSLIINIKERVVDGERSTYVLELIIAMRKQGWLWTEEYIWHKKNSAPGKWPNRFRDAWERCLHFTKSKKFFMNQEAVMVSMGDWAKSRLKTLSESDKERQERQTGSGFGFRTAAWAGRDLAYPSNVLHLPTECGNKGHSAAFPKVLPAWFVKLFTRPGDVVLDPFVGSGTTLDVCGELGRHSVGFEMNINYYRALEKKFEEIDYEPFKLAAD